jgi:hypothetical protein
MLDAIHLDKDFVQVPFRSDRRSLPSQQQCIKRAELLRRRHASPGHHLFDVAIAQGKSKVQPHALLYHFDGKSVPMISAHQLTISYTYVDDAVGQPASIQL